MSVYKHILVAVDFSDINRLAVERASNLARQNNCELVLLHVIEHFPIDSGPLSSVFQYNTEPVEVLSQDVRAKFNELVNTLGYKDAKTEFRITSKSARYEILRFAREHEVDLIVVAPMAKVSLDHLDQQQPVYSIMLLVTCWQCVNLT